MRSLDTMRSFSEVDSVTRTANYVCAPLNDRAGRKSLGHARVKVSQTPLYAKQVSPPLLAGHAIRKWDIFAASFCIVDTANSAINRGVERLRVLLRET